MTGTSGAVLVEAFQYSPLIDYTCGNGTALYKGMLLGLADPRTASGSATYCATPNCAFAGIAAADKEASDGITNISVYKHGIFDIEAQSVISIGQPVMMSGCYAVSGAGLSSPRGAIVGIAQESAAAEGEVIEVLL